MKGEQGGCIGPDGDKSGMSEGHLTAIADQELDTQGPHNGIGHQVGDTDPIEASPERENVEDKNTQEEHLADDEFGLPPGVVLLIIFVINSAR